MLNQAEDFARVLSVDQDAKVPFGSFEECLETTETSGVEPDILEFKLYAPGVGLVFVNDVSGKQKVYLVNIIREK